MGSSGSVLGENRLNMNLQYFGLFLLLVLIVNGAPKPDPKPSPKAAPEPIPKAAPKPIPKAAPKPNPNPYPKPTPKAKAQMDTKYNRRQINTGSVGGNMFGRKGQQINTGWVGGKVIGRNNQRGDMDPFSKRFHQDDMAQFNDGFHSDDMFQHNDGFNPDDMFQHNDGFHPGDMVQHNDGFHGFQNPKQYPRTHGTKELSCGPSWPSSIPCFMCAEWICATGGMCTWDRHTRRCNDRWRGHGNGLGTRFQ